MQQLMNAYDVGYCDETVVQVLKEANRPAEAHSYMWLFIGGAKRRIARQMRIMTSYCRLI